MMVLQNNIRLKYLKVSLLIGYFCAIFYVFSQLKKLSEHDIA